MNPVALLSASTGATSIPTETETSDVTPVPSGHVTLGAAALLIGRHSYGHVTDTPILDST